MLNRALICVLAMSLGTCLLSSGVRAEEELVDNPAYKSWAGHKVGSSITYENSTAVGPQKFKAEMTQKLVELTKEKAVVEMTIKLDIPGAAAPPAQKTEIPAKAKKSEATPGKLPEGVKGKVTEKGTEKINVAGKSYECKVWEFTGEQDGTKMSGKTWTSEKIPGTMAKMESTGNAAGQEMKITMTVTKMDLK